jgi:short-subunit dehydrogenase
MSARRSSIVFGGSSGVGRALVELLAARGDRVLATSRDLRDLEALQRDCVVRFGAEVNIEAIDVSSSDFDPTAFVERCIQKLGHITHVFLPVGAISSEDKAIVNDELIADLALVNYTRPAQLLSAFCKHFEKNGDGHAMIFSSIAAAAPRSNNAAYASAKAALEFYCRALQHHFSGSAVSIQICVLGYVDTSMSFGLKLRLPIATPTAAARYAIRMSETNARLAYFPRFWSPITAILNILPWSIYKRLRF